MSIDPVAIVRLTGVSNGRCRRCGASVVWYQSATGTWLPFNGRPTVHNIHRDETSATRVLLGEIRKADLHWRTCPAMNALDHRTSRGSR
jgi:hypothetical protein